LRECRQRRFTDRPQIFHRRPERPPDEEVIALWLSVSYLEEHHVPMFVAKQWAEKATNISEWMALLERNTAPRGTN
jgi:hypothetical protein